MTVARFPQLAHWGAFTALVEAGRVIGCDTRSLRSPDSRPGDAYGFLGKYEN